MPTAVDVTRERDVADLAQRIATAISRRDAEALRGVLAPGFVHRTHGGPTANAEQFLRAIAQIPGKIKFIRLEFLVIDLVPGGAMATGVQHSQVVVEGQVIDDRRGFVDWFVMQAGAWRLQAAVDLAVPPG